MAAIATSLLLTKQRQERLPAGAAPAGENPPAPRTLDAIRAAGL